MESWELQSVLVADDDPGCRTSVAEIARAKGLEVFEASCGREAVALFAEHDVDLTIFDVHMPEGSGVECWRRIVLVREVPGIFITGEPSRALVDQLRALGALTLLLKPLDMDELSAALEATPRWWPEKQVQPEWPHSMQRVFDWERFAV